MTAADAQTPRHRDVDQPADDWLATLLIAHLSLHFGEWFASKAETDDRFITGKLKSTHQQLSKN